MDKEVVISRQKATMPKFDFEMYKMKLMARCVIYPNLNSAELQDSYGVHDPESLIGIMLRPGELQELYAEVSVINGFDTTITELVDEAKN